MHQSAASALPLDERQDHRLREAVNGLTPAQLQWVSGYVAGLAASDISAPAPAELQDQQFGQQLTVLVGSQTGNGERIAEQLVVGAQERGFAARVVSLADFKPSALKRETLVAFVISTHGEGDPPDDAELFHDYLMSRKAGDYSNLRYAVLALGDSSYVNFCQTGREFDRRLAELGAMPFEAITECDLDFEMEADAWSERVAAGLADLVDEDARLSSPSLRAVGTGPVYDKHNPYTAEVLVNQRITSSDSTRDVRHIELSIEGSGLSYEPGDSIAVLVRNPPQLVDEMLDVLSLDAGHVVEFDGASVNLRDALLDHLEITALSLPFLRKWAGVGGSEALQAILEDKDTAKLGDLIASHQVIDIVRQYPFDVDSQSFVDMLRKLSPRSYSIACGPSANPGEVHLTVSALRYEAFNQPHWGAASTMLADRIAEGEEVSIFVEPNPRFRMPPPDVPIIMIGPGTGVAPFRAFVEERIEQGAKGGCWLFFGNRCFSDDFLYQLEWQRHLKRGGLDRLDVAFSRDQVEKIYVQDRLRSHSDEIYRWIEQGAVIYVCGDAKRMAGDVEEALIDILVERAGIDRSAALALLKQMKRGKTLPAGRLLMSQKTPSDVELIKAGSSHLRGTMLASLDDPVTGAIAEADTQLSKFHGIYQQDDRDLRSERTRQKLEPAYSFMIRARIPGGLVSTDQWLQMDQIARVHANGSIRLTTRQAVQFHGVIKRDLKKTVATINHAALDTLAACGDVNRNVMAPALPGLSGIHRQVQHMAVKLSAHLTPASGAYHEIWLDGKKLEPARDEVEPIYGDTYLPRKFKAAFVVPPQNDVDVFTQDLGFIAIVENGDIVGFNVTVGGGMGMTHGDAATYPRLGDVIGFCSANDVLSIAEAVVTTQRDYGDRSNRKHARLKYTIDDRGIDWFRDEVQGRSGVVLEDARRFAFAANGDAYGWQRDDTSAWHYTMFVENGRVIDKGERRLMSGLRSVAEKIPCEYRLTPNQNLIISDVAGDDRDRLVDVLHEFGIENDIQASPLRLNSMACVGFPTCGLAMAESERYLPGLIDKLDVEFLRHGLADAAITTRMTGCANGCARPYIAEIGLVGKGPGRYTLFLGAGFAGERLGTAVLDNANEQEILEVLSPLLRRYAAERLDNERFGNFLLRTGLLEGISKEKAAHAS